MQLFLKSYASQMHARNRDAKTVLRTDCLHRLLRRRIIRLCNVPRRIDGDRLIRRMQRLEKRTNAVTSGGDSVLPYAGILPPPCSTWRII